MSPYSFKYIFPLLIFFLFFFCLHGESNAQVSAQSDKGKAIFEQKCSPCHTIGGGKKVGPDLMGVMQRRRKDWLEKWIANPTDMVKSGDSAANELIKQYPIQMPALGLSQEEIAEVLDYLEAYKPAQEPSAVLPLAKEKRREAAFSSRTYMQILEDPRERTYGRLQERMDLELRSGDKWGFSTSGLVRYDTRSQAGEQRELDELTYAFLTYAPLSDRRLLFNIGRHYFFDGIAAEHVDGLSSRWQITPASGVAFFGGRPVQTEFDDKRGDFVYGGRAYQRIGKRAEVGASFLREDNDNARFREEYGIDIWLLPLKKMQVQGHSFWNDMTHGWMEHSYNLRLALNDFQVTGIFSQINYTDAFSGATLSVFSPEFLGKGERLTKIGGSGEYRIGKSLAVFLDLREYDYKLSGDAWYVGAGGSADLKEVSAGASIHRMNGDTERLRYMEYRAYIKKTLTRITLVLDALNIHYDLPFRDLKNAYSISGTAVVGINKSLSAGADLNFSKSPDFTHAAMLLLKLNYNLTKEL